MSIETEVYSALAGHTGLQALVGNGDSPETYRIYPVKLPQDDSAPGVVYQKISAVPVNDLGGSNAKENSRIQIDCVGLTYASVKAVTVQIKAAMAAATNFKSLLLLEQDIDFDDGINVGTKTYRVSLDFSTWL